MPEPILSFREEQYQFEKAPPIQDLLPGVMWILSGAGGVCAVNFFCPCGCGSKCYTPVTDTTKGQPKTERHWLFSREPDGSVTLTPSIQYVNGCKAHFNITGGKTVFHGDSGK